MRKARLFWKQAISLMLLIPQVKKRHGTKSSSLGDFELEDPRVTSEHHSVSLWWLCELMTLWQPWGVEGCLSLMEMPQRGPCLLAHLGTTLLHHSQLDQFYSIYYVCVFSRFALRKQCYLLTAPNSGNKATECHLWLLLKELAIASYWSSDGSLQPQSAPSPDRKALV